MHIHPCRLRVLIVDDCKDTARSYAILLNTWGHDTVIAHDGAAALELARLAWIAHRAFRPLAASESRSPVGREIVP